MKDQELFDEAFASIPKDSEIFIAKLTEIAERIESLLKERNWSQHDLAKKIGKHTSEINKWLNTPHNLTLRSIAKMEAVFGVELITVPKSEVSKAEAQAETRKTIDDEPLSLRKAAAKKPEEGKKAA